MIQESNLALVNKDIFCYQWKSFIFLCIWEPPWVKPSWILPDGTRDTFILLSGLNLFLSLADFKNRLSYLISLLNSSFCKVYAFLIWTDLHLIFNTMYIRLFLLILSNLVALLIIHFTQESILTYFFICLYLLFLKATEYKLTLYACY